MKNLKQRLKEALVYTAVFTVTSATFLVGNYLDRVREEKKINTKRQWQNAIQGYKERDCATAYHYGNMHGHFIEDLGWSEERCPYAF